MNEAGLGVWLASIADLTAEQRSDGYRALAMAEAEDDTTVVVGGVPDSAVSSCPPNSGPAGNGAAGNGSATPQEMLRRRHLFRARFHWPLPP